ncbi:MAG TPA: sulfatase-like hydrolase/transferase, partial [Pseudomonadota bacterium]|nr:sulfatase-like hydrolase/transferase [Pseudomonadota bacterium]
SDRYDQELVVVDAALGRLVRYLQAERPEAQIVVTADHGEAFNDHGESLHGTNLYEEQIRVPLVLAGPGIPAGVYKDPVQLIDVAPTLLQLAGSAVPATLDGHTLLSAQPGAARGSQFAVSGLGSQYALIAWPWKLTRELHTNQTKLYDLAVDPGETQDQSQTQAATRLRLQGELNRWLDARLRAAGDLDVEPRRPTPPTAILRGRLGDAGATVGLRDLLATTRDDALRMQAARLLLRLPDPSEGRGRSPLPAIAASAATPPADELKAVLAVLSLRAGQRAWAPTVHAISRSAHYDLELRLRAAEALASLRDERALPALLALLDLFQEQGEYRSCREVIAALAKLRDRRAVPALVSRLDNVMVQLEVITALDAIAAPESVRPLIELLANSQRVPNRIAAATTLGRIGRGRARRALLRAAQHDPEPPVRKAAKAALAAHPAIRSGASPPTR